ncbi:MAG: hypothetical protein RBQ97_11330 [Acholeplasma sp.]|nr:hypothetical protein [Acholeplasma sp.]
MKKLMFILVICIILTLAGCGTKQLSMKESKYIVLKDEDNGEYIEITDEETVEKITNDINSLSLKKGKTIELPPGWSYQLIWYNSNDEIQGVIGIVDGSTLGYKDNYYSVSKDEIIDIELFDELSGNEQ